MMWVPASIMHAGPANGVNLAIPPQPPLWRRQSRRTRPTPCCIAAQHNGALKAFVGRDPHPEVRRRILVRCGDAQARTASIGLLRQLTEALVCCGSACDRATEGEAARLPSGRCWAVVESSAMISARDRRGMGERRRGELPRVTVRCRRDGLEVEVEAGQLLRSQVR